MCGGWGVKGGCGGWGEGPFSTLLHLFAKRNEKTEQSSGETEIASPITRMDVLDGGHQPSRETQQDGGDGGGGGWRDGERSAERKKKKHRMKVNSGVVAR